MAVVLAVALQSSATTNADRRFIFFKDAEDLSIANSHTIAARRHVVQSAEDSAYAQQVKRYPQFGFNASSMFQSKVGQINVPALGMTQQVGSTTNWSVGPVVDWVVWDTGQIMNKARSLGKTADARGNALEYEVRQVLLGARAAYIGVQLAKEQVRLVSDALRLARAQYAYVQDRKKVGTADLFDLAVAHQEMMDREKDLEQAKGELAISKRDLVAALGMDDQGPDADAIDVEPIGSVLTIMLPRSSAPVDVVSHPRVKELANTQDAYALASKSIMARYVPQVTLRGTSTYEYPNLGLNETIQQNKLMLNLSVPILDWGMVHRESRSQRHQASAAMEEKNQAVITLSRDVADVRERIGTTKRLRVVEAKSVRDAIEVANLSFSAYKDGKIIFLDVQKANVKALSVKVEAARNDASLALHIARLLALAETEGETK